MKKDTLDPKQKNEIMNREDLLLDITALVDDEQCGMQKEELLKLLAEDEQFQKEFYIQLKIKNLLRHRSVRKPAPSNLRQKILFRHNL